MKEEAIAPFRQLFGRIWSDVSSVNGRRDRSRMLLMDQEPFVKQVRFAQASIFSQKFTQNTPIVVEEDGVSVHQFEYRIDASWLAGLIGVLEVKLPRGPAAIVVLRTDDIHEMVVIKNPKSNRSPKDKVEVDLTVEQKEEAIELAKKQLRAGYPLKHVPSSLSHLFRGAKVWLVDDDDEEPRYEIEYASKERVDWEEEATCIKDKFVTYELEEDNWVLAALKARGSVCISVDAEEQFKEVLAAYPLVVLKRLYTYLSHYRPTIALYDIARDGSAPKLDVSLTDSAVHEILCAVCALYPCSLELGPTDFVVKNGPMMWSLKDLIKSHMDTQSRLEEMDIEEGDEYWPPIPGDPKTPLFSHQEETVHDMLAKVANGKRGHELVLDVGLGKTMFVMSFIQSLVESKKMPTYCVYSAPPSAIANALSEFERFGIPYHVVLPSNGKKGGVACFEKYKVNVVEHDQMRRADIYEWLKTHATDMLFVVDEFHLASTSTTIRSSIALEISRLSRDFVGMTGTIVRNAKCGDLIMWLEMIVDFFIDIHNYLVAFGALLSKKYNTGVVINHLSVMAPFKDDEEECYYAKVTPKLGGTANQFNFQAATAVCYEACDREIIKQVLYYVHEQEEIVFVLAKSKEHQQKLKEMLTHGEKRVRRKEVFLIDKQNSITLKPETKTRIKVVITTLLHITGYTLTKIKTCITGVYPSNESTRHQFVGRLDRIGQPSAEITVVNVHCGVLSYLHANYNKVRSHARSLKEFADETSSDYASLATEMCK